MGAIKLKQFCSRAPGAFSGLGKRGPEFVRRFGLLLIFLAALPAVAEVIPPKPARYFNDSAGVVRPETALRFNEQLAQFERDTSNQVVVAIFHKMETNSDIADYTQRIAQSWGVGQKGRRNGAVLFVFVDDHKMFIQVGYGLEGVLPDVTAFDITERHIKPKFRAGDYEGGLATGIDLICKAIKGEYQGSGQTVQEKNVRQPQSGSGCSVLMFVVILLLVLLIIRRAQRRGYRYSSFGGPFIGGWGGGGWGGGGWSSGGGGGGFSGFSGGGGSFGGGGAGSSW
jgi:uncharacterized protein